LAEKAFVTAEINLGKKDLSKEEKEAAEMAIVSFKTAVEKFDKVVDEVGQTDADYGKELKNYMNEKIIAQKKNLSFALPDQPSYFAKEIISDVEILVADSETEVVEIKNEHGLSKVSEVEDMIEKKGDYKLAEKILGDSKDEVNEAIKIAKTIDGDEQIGDQVKKVQSVLSNVETKVVEGKTIEAVSVPVITAAPISTVTVPKEVEPVIPVDTYGVKIQDDKPLSPFLY